MLAVMVGLSLLGAQNGNIELLVLAWDGRSLPVLSYETIEETCTAALANCQGSGGGDDEQRRVSWLLRRGRARYLLKTAQEALPDLAECYRLRPNDDDVAFAYARCALSITADDGEGLGIAERLLRSPGSEARGHFLLGVHAVGKEQYECALRSFDRAVELAPDWMSARFGRGQAEYVLKQYQNSLDDLDRVLAHPEALAIDTSQVRALRAGSLIGLQRYEDAYAVMVDVYRGAIKANNLNLVGYIQGPLWDLCAWQGKFRECAYVAEKQIELFPNDPIGYRRAALAYATVDEFDLAMPFAEKALSLAVKDPDSWGTLARVYYQQGAFENALRCFLKAFASSKGELFASREDVARLAFILATCPDQRLRDGKMALRYLEKLAGSVKSRKWNAQVLAMRAICLAELGQTATAVELMDEAINVPPRPGESRMGFAGLRELFAQGLPYRHDPLAPETHLFSISPVGFFLKTSVMDVME